MQDLSHSSGIVVRLLPSAETLPALNRDYGDLYFRLDIPPNVYPGVNSSIGVVGVANVLVVNRSMPDDLAYDITRLIFEKQQELAAIHPEARNLALSSAIKGSPAEYHPGAMRFYRERGVWR